ncbi:hypothetical protein [Methylobacterium sp. 17Sr1-1]|uniref:hypothetical protein n=1 Tax=Methylobacterium sp. 17Sr1-1 TaxID=2202826 RepID=UPI0019510E30|nr:hypothetical protein [Methylobacterium sp. 17Sr1-1]
MLATLLLSVATTGEVSAEQDRVSIENQMATPASEIGHTNINLGGGFIEFLLTGRVSSVPRSIVGVGQEAQVHNYTNEVSQGQSGTTPATMDGEVKIIDYSGNFAPGSVIINVTKKEVYHILPDGKMKVLRNGNNENRLAKALTKKLSY